MRTIFVVGAMLLFAGTAGRAAAQTAGEKCQAGKNEAAGKLAACLAKAEKKFVLTSDAIAFGEAATKCGEKFNTKWSKLEQKAVDAGSVCTTTTDATDIHDFIDGCTDAVAVALAGSPLIDDPVTCDGNLTTCNSNLSTCSGNLSTCNSNYASCSSSLSTCNSGTATAADVLAGKTFSSSAGLGVTGTALPGQRLKTDQTTCYNSGGTVIACAGTGQDGELQKGLAVSYTTNGDGTLTDNRTGLIWEKLSDDNTVHDKDRMFTWNNAFKKVQVLNGNAAGCIGSGNPDACCTGAGTGSCSAFTGQTDWRLPNANELQSIAKYGGVNPAVDAAFNTGCVASCTVTGCSCTMSDGYWSSTTYQILPSYAWSVHFNGGGLSALDKSNGNYVRAVRGGS